ncbi:hypothetical protein SAPIO_CDS2997 [Scedosporium apiospermum]|uniref:Ribosomal eL28/Mak16 domain-containing protein n=1 Tax=Pseudallescheria apiosperma TaxID=563466 RepID=A0A084GC05_PSEDA|nr:uncharacterized protein SAPIO_CDS2997 [Scedosporium apiospermum]KEZ44867.1 hypothetical protein SAPIO_CDS2997 [Scedosporium apiospermum]
MSSNVSADLIWEVVRSQNKYLVKRKTNGSPQFSRDPLNLTNVHSRKYAGFVNDKAIGINASGKRGISVVSKNAGSINKPSASYTSTVFGDAKSNRKAYKAVAGLAAKRGYRGDLREAAVQRVSAIRRSQLPEKPEPEKKLRGKKAQQAQSA